MTETAKNWSNINTVFTNPLLQWQLYVCLAPNRVAEAAAVNTKCGVISTSSSRQGVPPLVDPFTSRWRQRAFHKRVNYPLASPLGKWKLSFPKRPWLLIPFFPSIIRLYASEFIVPSQTRNRLTSRCDMQPQTMFNANLRRAIKLLIRPSSYVRVTDISSNAILTFIAKNCPVFNSPVSITFSFCIEIYLHKLWTTFWNLAIKVLWNTPTSLDRDNSFISGA
jgi:hypothetical protein